MKTDREMKAPQEIKIFIVTYMHCGRTHTRPIDGINEAYVECVVLSSHPTCVDVKVLSAIPKQQVNQALHIKPRLHTKSEDCT